MADDGQPLYFERVAVTKDQIAEWSLPTRPTKLAKNRHAIGWAEDDESVELDAIPAGQLRDLVREAIEQHVDEDELARLRQIEAEEREQLTLFARQLAAKGDDEPRGNDQSELPSFSGRKRLICLEIAT